MGKVVMALDQGTTSSRTLLFDRAGGVVASAQREFPQHYPRPGWVEHDPEDIWQTQLATARDALRAAGLAARDVAAVGIANQRETVCLWHRRTGEPVGPAIVWQCRRTAPACQAIRERGEEPLLRQRTGLVADAYFSATKLAWLLEHVPGARGRAERGELAFGTVDSWLLWRLTGGARHATDASNASRTLLFHLDEQRWDEALLDYFGIPATVLPEVVPSAGEAGTTDEALLGAALPVAGIAGDQQAALFGQGCLSPGQMKNTYGTGCFLLANTGERPVRPTGGLLSSTAWHLPDRRHYVLEGAIFIAGAAVQWLRDGLGLIASAAETEALARSVPDTAGVAFVPAFTGLGAPHWDAEARGAIVGLTQGATRAHLARAALEAIAFQTVDLVEAMAGAFDRRPEALRVDGGATANDFLCQVQADLLGLPVDRPANRETTAAGAAYLAGLATGFWDSPEQVAALRRPDRVFEPGHDAAWRGEQLARWHKAVERVRV